MKLEWALRNAGASAVRLGSADKALAYLLIGQGQEIFYSEKILPEAKGWPVSLEPGQTLPMPATDLAVLKAFAYARGMKLAGGYPSAPADQPATPLGDFAGLLKPATATLRMVFYLEGERPMMLEGPRLKLEIQRAEFAALSPQRQRQELADLAADLRKDAWSARNAHDRACRIGQPAIATLAEVLRDEQAGEFARMWAATALADIGGEGAVGPLLAALQDPASGVRDAAAYHGIKLQNPLFDQPLMKLAISGQDPMITAWTIMGYLKFRKAVPEELLKAGLASKEWKVRAAVAETVSRGNPDKTHLPILRALLADENENIRATAAGGIAQVGDASAATIDALVGALAPTGEKSRETAVKALADLTKNAWTYAGSAAQKQSTIQKIQQWWKDAKPTWK